MVWKNWSYWLKGVIVTFAVYIPIFFIFTKLKPMNFLVLEIPAIPILILLPRIGIELGGTSGLTILFFILLVYYSIIGAIIGWLVGRHKKQKTR